MAYDTTGATVGAAGHDAAALVAALLPALADENALGAAEDVAFGAWQRLRDRILADSLAVQEAQSNTPAAKRAKAPADNPAEFAMPWGKHKGKTLDELHALPESGDEKDGASYLTWVVANSNDARVVATVKAFLAAR